MVGYLYAADHHPEGVRKIEKLCEDKLVYKDIKSLVYGRDIYQIERKN